MNTTDMNDSHRRWCAERKADLAAPDSWLGLVGLFWLEPGENAVGHAPDCGIVLPFGPDRLGSLWVAVDEVTWQPEPASGAQVAGCGERIAGRQRLSTDRAGTPSEIVCGALVLIVIERDGRLAVRIRNRNWSVGKQAVQLDYFDYDPAWKIDASWEALAQPLNTTVPNVSGELKQVAVTHQAAFTVAGQVVKLLPMSVGDNEVFFVFRDHTSGRQTYGAGRFLKVPVAVNGKISLDFNFAYNPPCAFTAFATCPLPPPENWLPFAVAAGEKKWEQEF